MLLSCSQRLFAVSKPEMSAKAQFHSISSPVSAHFALSSRPSFSAARSRVSSTVSLSPAKMCQDSLAVLLGDSLLAHMHKPLVSSFLRPIHWFDPSLVEGFDVVRERDETCRSAGRPGRMTKKHIKCALLGISTFRCATMFRAACTAHPEESPYHDTSAKLPIMAHHRFQLSNLSDISPSLASDPFYCPLALAVTSEQRSSSCRKLSSVHG